jgi:adenylosuccinate lyase
MAHPDDPRAVYQNPLIARYASREIAGLFSDRTKFSTWRRLWLALAEAEAELGLPITEEQLLEMREHLDDIDFEAAEAEERKRRHDVMAHVHAFGLAAPKARPILHLGATSAFVGDNADLVQVRTGLRLLCGRLASVLAALADFAGRHRDLPCLGATHLQPAQPTTVGKRATLWAQDLLLDLEEISRTARELPLRGVKGTTGTQASYLELFEGDDEKVRELERRVVEKMGFSRAVAVTGQTYPRKLDVQVLGAVAGVADSAGRIGSDVRILQAFGELAEPFGKDQTGSSAMAYKRNPMRSERACSLARYLQSLVLNAQQTASNQWLERTLDDSANRRLSIPQAFLAADAILILLLDVVRGLEVFPKVVERRLAAELPFLATEVVLMEGVKAGGDRQHLHERVRVHAHAAAERVRERDGVNDLMERLAANPAFRPIADRLASLTEPERFVGRAPAQVDEFLADTLRPALGRHEREAASWGAAGSPAEAEVRV